MSKKLFRWVAFALAAVIFGSVAVMAVSSADNGTWQASYFNNTTLQGSPALTRNDNIIDFNWGEGSPAEGINADLFSARWTKTVNLAPGVYRFTMTSDDGSRLFVNNNLVLNQWWEHTIRTTSAEVYIPGGNTDLRVEYYEQHYGAIVSMRYDLVQAGTATPAPRPTNTPIPPTAVPTQPPAQQPPAQQPPANNGGNPVSSCVGSNWSAKYFDNQYLAGMPAISRQDAFINYNWGFGSPGNNLPADDFSALWTTTFNLEEGVYTFTISADDGAAVWVDNRQLINIWWDHELLTDTRNYRHDGGPLTVRVEYYENGGRAQVAFSCARVDNTAPPPTATPVPRPTNTPIPPTPVPPQPTNTPVPPPPAPTNTPQPAPTVDPDLTADAGKCLVSNAHVLNLRSGPGIEFAIVTQVEYGDMLTRTGDRSGNWVEVRTEFNAIGWLNEYYCGSGEMPAEEEEEPPARSCNAVTVLIDALYVRSGPGTGYTWVDLVHHGDVLCLAGERNSDSSWVSVYTPDGVYGWVYCAYTDITDSQLNSLTYWQ